MMPRALAGTGGPVLGLVFVAATFGILIGTTFFYPSTRADCPADRHRLRRGAGHDGRHRVGRHRLVGRLGGCADDGHRGAAAGAGWSPAAAALGAIAAAAMCGVANGSLITGLRVVPFIVTLGTMILVRGLAKGLPRSAGSKPHTRGSTTCCARAVPLSGVSCRQGSGWCWPSPR